MRNDEWEPSLGGDESDQEVSVTAFEDEDGHRRVLVLPKSLRRLEPEQQDVAWELQQAVVQAMRARELVEQLAAEAREAGLSWNVIGWCVGTSPQAARKRFGSDDA